MTCMTFRTEGYCCPGRYHIALTQPLSSLSQHHLCTIKLSQIPLISTCVARHEANLAFRSQPNEISNLASTRARRPFVALHQVYMESVHAAHSRKYVYWCRIQP